MGVRQQTVPGAQMECGKLTFGWIDYRIVAEFVACALAVSASLRVGIDRGAVSLEEVTLYSYR